MKLAIILTREELEDAALSYVAKDVRFVPESVQISIRVDGELLAGAEIETVVTCTPRPVGQEAESAIRAPS